MEYFIEVFALLVYVCTIIFHSCLLASHANQLLLFSFPRTQWTSLEIIFCNHDELWSGSGLNAQADHNVSAPASSTSELQFLTVVFHRISNQIHNWSISAIPDQTPKKWSSFRTEEDVNSRGGGGGGGCWHRL
jgi:hypothetical protein